jgi:hypothetical protein
MQKIDRSSAKSLNLTLRLKETQRIQKENQVFATRLFSKSSVIRKQELDQQYEEHL